MVKASDVIIAVSVGAGVLAAWCIALSVSLAVLNGQDVKTIDSVPPAGGNINLEAGSGIGIVPSISTNTIEIENEGVITINSLTSSAGNIVLAVTTPGLSVVSSGSTVTFTNGGVTQAIAGTGIGVSSATGNVTFSNTGVLSLAAGAGLSVNASTGAITVANTGVLEALAGSGIGVSGATGNVTFSNTGVLTINSASPITGNMVVAAGAGVTVTTSTNTITVADTISAQTAAARPNANAPTMTYAINIGSTTPIPVATWRIGPAVGAPPNPWSPGSSQGGGYGDLSGVAWAVPASSTGIFGVNANCEILPSAIAASDLQIAYIAFSLGATTEDPASGVIPSGAYQTLPLAGGVNSTSAPPLPRQLALSTMFQACATCTVVAGDALTVHARMDHTGYSNATYTMTVVCDMTVTHLR